ncbi:dynein regulatory complex protein 9 isoform X1 [Daphnia magna]|uniref:dynein regulatory complex protein 9 isoform X1 n=1 Tax=Daphnia magna TaxID=35525 RepID=UPI001E1BC842|nr:dynein regulatory complex protein 9 isoform X1 [Daphnia magna]XP_032795493.2 dynein regulatory complex protein 9 isoform X1 [Daphnia magna]
MEEICLLKVALEVIFDQTIDKLILHETIRDGNSNSDFSRWSCIIEKTLKDALSEPTGNPKLSLSVHTAEMELLKEMEISEKQKQEHICSKIEYEKKVLDNHKTKLFTTSKVLNGNICKLKDGLDRRAESTSKSFVHCENQEENFVKSFNEKFRLEQEEWGNKITALERDIEQENYRNTEEKMKLCSEIDKLTLSASTMQIYWETFSKALTQERDEILRMHEAIRSQVNIISDKLIKRQTLVNQDRQEKQRAEEENLAFAKLSMVVIKIQSWWRGILARRDYARYRIACKKKPRQLAQKLDTQQKKVVHLKAI